MPFWDESQEKVTTQKTKTQKTRGQKGKKETVHKGYLDDLQTVVKKAINPFGIDTWDFEADAGRDGYKTRMII
jgi:hypothetical protein